LRKATSNYASKVFLTLWAVNFLLTFTVSLISTPTPYLTSEFFKGRSDIESATMEAYGIILSLGYVAMTIGYFLGGFTADTLGRKALIIASFIILTTGFGLFAVAPNLYFLFLASFAVQFALGFSGPAISALVADYSTQRSRGMAYGVFNLSWVTAQIPAPILGGVIAQYVTTRAPFLIAIFIGIGGILFSAIMKVNHTRKESMIEEENGSVERQDPIMPLGKVVFLFSMSNLLNGMLNGFAGPLITGILIFRLGADPAAYGLVSSIAFGVVTGLVQIPGGKLADKFGRKPLALSASLAIPLVIVLGFSQSILDFALIMGAISAVGNISSPAISAWLMDLVPKRKRASVSGITRTLNGIGLSVGPTAGSYAWNAFKPDAVIPCGIVALLLAFSLVSYALIKEPAKNGPPSGNVPKALN
jgi:MFS family permease